MKQSLLNILKFILFVGTGVTILYFVYQNQNASYILECQCKGGCEFDSLVDKIINDFTGANVFWLMMICLVFMISNLSRALRWNMLIEPLGYKPKVLNSFFATMVGYFINLALPRAGEIVKPATLTQYEKIPLEKLIGTIVVDRAFDVLMLILITGLTFVLQFNYIYDFLFGEAAPTAECVEEIPLDASSNFPWLLILKIGIGVFFISLLFIAAKWKTLKTTTLVKKIIALINNFIAGIKTVSKLKKPGVFILHTLNIWLMYYLMMYLGFFAFAPTAGLSPLVALLAFTFSVYGMVIPSPGGMGTYQLAVTSALVIYGIADSDAFAYSNIIFFTVNVFCNIFFGVLAYILLPIYNRGYVPESPLNH